MKCMRLIAVILIFAAVVGLINMGAIPSRIPVIAVQKVILETEQGTVELSRSEVRKLIRLCNFAPYEMGVNAEPGCAAYSFTVCFYGGVSWYVEQGVADKVIVRPARGGMAYYLKSQRLIDYICELAQTYGLSIE